MKAVLLLLWDLLRTDRLRLGCALLGIAAAAALLTWTLGLAATAWHQGRPLCERMGRPFDCWVATARASAAAPKGTGFQALTPGSPFKLIPEGVRTLVEASPDVLEARSTAVFRTSFDWRPGGRPADGPGFTAGLAPAADFPEGSPYPEGLSEGRWPQPGNPPEFAVAPAAFGDDPALRPPVGTAMTVVTPAGRTRAVLCGYLGVSTRPVGGFPTAFANDALAGRAVPEEARGACNLILIRLRPGADAKALQAQVRSAVPDDDAARLVTRDELLFQLRSDAISNLSRQLPLLVLLAFVGTVCMIVNALCLGIEQHRTRYARLRALGMTAGQLTGLVAGEGAALTLCGTAAGFAAGAAALAGYVAFHADLFGDGMRLGVWTLPGVLAALLTALAVGLVIPLRRIRALDPALLRHQEPGTVPRRPLRRLVLSAALLLPALLTAFQPIRSPTALSLGFLLIALPCFVWGLLRMTPALLTLCERMLAPPLGAVLGLRSALLRGSLTRALRRNGRMALTLTAGLGAFFAVHIWGASLTEPFLPSRELPPAIVSVLPNGTAPDTLDWSGAGLRPFSAEQYRLHDEDYAAICERTGLVPEQNNILLIGTEGDTGVTVTEMFARQCGLREGDTFRIQRKDREGRVHTLPLTVTAVRRINWHLFTARAGLRARNGAPFGTLGPVFVGADAARAWDPERTAAVRFLWADGLTAGSDGALYAAADALERRVQQAVDAAEPPAAQAGPGRRAPRLPSQVTVRLRDEIYEGTLSHSADLVGALARLPLWSLLILCVGFVPLLTANVRTMAGELRTLHAVGMTRFQMGRFLMAQAVMLCAATAVLSLAAGVAVGWGFTGWTLAWMPFGGLPTVLEMPWGQMLKGTALLFCVTLVLTLPLTAALIRSVLRR